MAADLPQAEDEKRMKTADRASSLTLLGISAYFLFESRKFSPFGALFPRVIIYILIALSAALLIISFFRKKEPEKPEEEKRKIIPALITFILIIAWAVLINYIGFFVTSVLFFAVITLFLDGGASTKMTRVKRVLITAAVVTAFYLFFAKVLIVPFPEGVLF